MWAAPAAPTEAQTELLKASATESHKRAAAVVAQADVLLLLTGAGWSADSGLAVYRDVADVDAYRERCIDYAGLCNPSLLDDDPDLFVGFWGRCFNDYRDTPPHEGYSIIRRWRDERFAGTETARRLASHHGNYDLDQESGPASFFSYTSNVDAHHLRFFPTDEVRECHGNSETWQCSEYECAHGRKRGAYRSGTSTNVSGCWEAPAGYRFRVDETTQLAPAAGLPQCDVEATCSTLGEQSFREKNHPICPRCGKAARPAILMFGDWAWRDDDEQAKRWERWLASLHREQDARVAAWATNHATAHATTIKDAEECLTAYASATGYPEGTAPLRVAIVEVGAGGNVTTVRNLAEELLRTLAGCGADPTLIRINPELPLADLPRNQLATISIMSKGLEAVRQIDEALRALCGQGEAVVRVANARPIPLAIDRKGRSLAEQAVMHGVEEEIARHDETKWRRRLLAHLAEAKAASGHIGLRLELELEPEPELELQPTVDNEIPHAPNIPEGNPPVGGDVDKG